MHRIFSRSLLLRGENALLRRPTSFRPKVLFELDVTVQRRPISAANLPVVLDIIAKEKRWRRYDNTVKVLLLGMISVQMYWLAQYHLDVKHGRLVKPGRLMDSTSPLEDVLPLIHDLSEENLKGARDEFLELLGYDAVNEDLGTRVAHSSTAWSSAPRGELDRPCIILYPSTTEDVSNIAKICHRRRIPMIGFSGGTSLEGTLAATHQEVCIDFERMNRVIQVNEKDMDVVVQPGVGYEDLNQMLESKGLFFPPDPGPGAKIGGMVAQGCSGTNAYRYGTMKDWVLGLTVVMADGTIIRTRRRARKSSAGYDLTRLIVGSEGTLGLVTEASLRLTNKPENVQVAVAGFKSVHQAIDTVIKILQSGHQLAAMELLDSTTMYAINEGGYSSKTWPEVPTLFLKFSGTPVTVKEQVGVVQKLAKASGCGSFQFSRNDTEASELWQARKTALWSLLAIKNDPEDKFLSADVAVPVSRLGDIIEATTKRLNESGLKGSCLGHVGDGNFHTTVLYAADEKEKARRIIDETQRLGIEMDGTITGEHGIGLEYRDMLDEELGVETVDAMRRVKLCLDPLCLLNPDKMIRVELPQVEPVRDGEQTVTEGGSSNSPAVDVAK